jgi:hypothetical protein
MTLFQKLLFKYRRHLSTYRAKVTVPYDLTENQCHQKIREALHSKKPFFLGRIGWTEADALGRWITEKTVPDKVKKPLAEWSGVFPVDDEELKKFEFTYREALPQADILAFTDPLICSPAAAYQGWLYRRYAPQALITSFPSLEPFFSLDPWSWELRGLKILVVHPFKESILKQYATMREKIFLNPKILPEFRLKVIQSPQTVPGVLKQYPSWSDTLEALKNQIGREDFDVAILGCGAYGFPLAAEVKKMGKVALHLGGITQLFFGIKGQRWDSDQPHYRSLMTEAWSTALQVERPPGFETRDYW